MQAFHRVQVPPTGIAHALSVRLTPSTEVAPSQSDVISHLVTARNSLLQVWEVRESKDHGRVGRVAAMKLHRNRQGRGRAALTVSDGTACRGRAAPSAYSTAARIHHVARSGQNTGIKDRRRGPRVDHVQGCKGGFSSRDSAVPRSDSLAHCIAARQMALLEWTPSAHDLLPVSLHTFEKLPQVVSTF